MPGGIQISNSYCHKLTECACRSRGNVCRCTSPTGGMRRPESFIGYFQGEKKSELQAAPVFLLSDSSFNGQSGFCTGTLHYVVMNQQFDSRQ